jgi:hypothetical protein
MSNTHNFELSAGNQSIEGGINLDTSIVSYTEQPNELTTRQLQLIQSFLTLLVAIYKAFPDFDHLECIEVE